MEPPHVKPSIALVVATQSNFAWRCPPLLRNAGFTVHLASTPGHLARRSDHLAASHTLRPGRLRRDLAAALRRVRPHVVLPTDDIAAETLRTLRSEPDLAEPLGSCLGDPAWDGVVSSKLEQMELATRMGLPTPVMRRVHDVEDIRAALAEMTLPVALKRDGAWAGFGVAKIASGGDVEAAWNRVTRRAGLASLLLACLETRNLDPVIAWQRGSAGRLHLQQWVEGIPANRAVVCRAGKVLGGLNFVAAQTRAAFGSAAVLRPIDHPGMVETAARMVEALGLSGLHGFDFVIDRKTGEALLIELNPRMTPAAAVPVPVAGGYDLLGILALSFGLSPSSVPPLKLPEIALFPEEWMRDQNSPYLHEAWHLVPWDNPALVAALVADARRAKRIDALRGHLRRLRTLFSNPG